MAFPDSFTPTCSHTLCPWLWTSSGYSGKSISFSYSLNLVLDTWLALADSKMGPGAACTPRPQKACVFLLVVAYFSITTTSTCLDYLLDLGEGWETRGSNPTHPKQAQTRSASPPTQERTQPRPTEPYRYKNENVYCCMLPKCPAGFVTVLWL